MTDNPFARDSETEFEADYIEKDDAVVDDGDWLLNFTNNSNHCFFHYQDLPVAALLNV